LKDEQLELDFAWERELVLIRGLPGSGKSTEANRLVGHSDFLSWHSHQIVEADLFAMVDGQYRFSVPLLPLAHSWCLAEAIRRLRMFDRVAVANTFVKLEHVVPYLLWARKIRARVWLVEPQGNSLTAAELAERNVHEVPEDRIAEMKDQWEPISQAFVDEFIGLPEDLRGGMVEAPVSEGVPESLKVNPWDQ
tara:strand:+ start:88381 stop:88959 length:579 start_codon:yes stop_codon:yes gene_type:complete